jgi:hypothetical protein
MHTPKNIIIPHMCYLTVKGSRPNLLLRYFIILYSLHSLSIKYTETTKSNSMDSTNFLTPVLYYYWLYTFFTVLGSEWWKHVVTNPWYIRLTMQWCYKTWHINKWNVHGKSNRIWVLTEKITRWYKNWFGYDNQWNWKPGLHKALML